jgi:hypothetical protein
MKADMVSEMLICVRDQPNSSSSGMMNTPNANCPAPMVAPRVRKTVPAIFQPR